MPVRLSSKGRYYSLLGTQWGAGRVRPTERGHFQELFWEDLFIRFGVDVIEGNQKARLESP